MNIHLVYPYANNQSSPGVIGWNLKEYLSKHHQVLLYNYDEIFRIKPGPSDVLIGHSHLFKNTILRRSAKLKGWRRKILLHPFNTDWGQNAYLDDVIDDFDSFLAITGNFWMDDLPKSRVKRWTPKIIQLNMAIDRTRFPFIKSSFNEAGKRRFIYIGNDHYAKNLDYLNQIAESLPEYEFAWAGVGRQRKNLKSLGYINFQSISGRKVLESYDFMITVGIADSNPTTILEAISFGLIPVCTKTSGYHNHPGIINISENNISEAKSLLKKLQYLDIDKLYSIQKLGSDVIKNYSWEIFCNKVLNEINSDKIYITESKNLNRVKSKIPFPYSKAYVLSNLLKNNIKYLVKKIIKFNRGTNV